MLKSLHLLLTYSCNYECDHCFLYCSPTSKGTFTLEQLRKVLDEATKLGTIESIYFEGGEPFLYYPIMLEGIKMCHEKGFKTGVVTNLYWANAIEDAIVWLKPLVEMEVDDISISDDTFHFGEEEGKPSSIAIHALKKLGREGTTICIEMPKVENDVRDEQQKGSQIVGGNIMFRGRAVEKLIKAVPQTHWKEFKECPYEDLEAPSRVHLDAFGNIHLCQGLLMGNMWKTPLSELLENYKGEEHPICRPLIKGGPALLAKKYDIMHEDHYVDACHFCFMVRKAMIEQYPDFLGPTQVYGIES